MLGLPLPRMPFFLALACACALPAAARAERFVSRDLTLPGHTAALDIGLGVGHADYGAGDATGFGMPIDLAYGLRYDLELGVRFGVRFGDDGRITRAERYGRPFQTEVYETSVDTFADPEIRLRWGIVRGPVELGLEGRMYVPFNGDFGIQPGLPVALHVGGVARIDTGIYVPILFLDRETETIVSIPFHLWFQVASDLWLGPVTGARHVNDDWQVPFGFGVGYAIGYRADLKTWLLFPDVSDGNADRQFGLGVGLQLRF